MFEEALSRVSTRLGLLAAQAASDLKAERLAAAQAGKAGGPGTSGAREETSQDPSVSAVPRGDRSLRSPASEKRRAGTMASGARRQAKRDAR